MSNHGQTLSTVVLVLVCLAVGAALGVESGSSGSGGMLVPKWQIGKYASVDGVYATLQGWAKPKEYEGFGKKRLLSVTKGFRLVIAEELGQNSFFAKEFAEAGTGVLTLDPLIYWTTHDNETINPAMAGFNVTLRELSQYVPRKYLNNFYFALRVWFHAVSRKHQALNSEVYGTWAKQVLPPLSQTSNLVLDWPAQRVEEMRPSDLRDRLKDHQKAIRMLVRWLRGAPNKLPADGPQISAEPLRWALTVALQRNPLGKARFPLVEDLLQCTTAPWEVNVQLEQPENVGEPAAYQLSNAVLGGSALLRECPELPMDLMMFQLGAIRSDNPNPLGFEVAVAVTDLRAIRLLPHLLQKRLRSSLHPKKEIHFTLDAPEIEAPLKAALRVASLTENELAAIADGSVSFNAAEMFSPENELLVYSYLWAAVQNRTNAMTTELHRSIFDYQREVHNSPAHHTFAHFLAEYQFQYLQLLDKLASFFTAQVTSLRSQHRISLGSSIMHLAEEEQPDTIL